MHHRDKCMQLNKIVFHAWVIGIIIAFEMVRILQIGWKKRKLIQVLADKTLHTNCSYTDACTHTAVILGLR